MWDCMHVGDVSCIPFFLATVVIGNLVVSILFAIIFHQICGYRIYTKIFSLCETGSQSFLGVAFEQFRKLKPVSADGGQRHQQDRRGHRSDRSFHRLGQKEYPGRIKGIAGKVHEPDFRSGAR